MTDQKYPYGQGFQRGVLSLVAQDGSYLSRFEGVIKPEYFDNPDHQCLCRLMIEHQSKYGDTPDYDTMVVLIQDTYQGTNVSKEDLESVLTEAHSLYSTVVESVDFLSDKVLKFGQRQALMQGVYKVVHLLEDTSQESYEQARGIIDKALVVGNPSDLGIDVGENLTALPETLRKSRLYDPTKKIRTLWPTIDRCLYGGISVGEVGVILGAKNAGKSTSLANLGAAAILEGHDVLHVTLELKDLDVALKYAARMTGLPMRSVMSADGEFFSRLKNIPIGPNRLRVKYFSPGTLDASMLRSYIQHLRSALRFHPRLLLIDYLKQMKLHRDYEGYGILMDKIIGLCDDFGMTCWTAHQLRRGSYRSEDASASDVGDSWQIVEKSDVVLVLSQTKEEKTQHMVRMGLECNRRGIDSVQNIMTKIKYEKAYMKEV